MLNRTCCDVALGWSIPLAEKTPTHTLVSWWVTLTLIERNAWLLACIKHVSNSTQCCTIVENEGRRERDRETERESEQCAGWATLTFNNKREQCATLSQQKRSVLSRHYKDRNQAGIIFSSVSVSGNFCKCKAQIKILMPGLLHTTAFFVTNAAVKSSLHLGRTVI